MKFQIWALGSVLVSTMTLAAPKAVKVMGTDGKPVGEVRITETEKGLKLALDLKGITPGPHGLHIHQNGKCDGPEFASAGGHFNPTDRKHGTANPDGSHLGDLPNLDVASNGVVKQELLARGVFLKPGMTTSLKTSTGSALVIHEKADDYKTDPSGDSGKRIYCAVLTEPGA